MKRCALVLTLAVVFNAALAGRPQAQYSIVDLGVLPGGGLSEALNVNEGRTSTALILLGCSRPSCALRNRPPSETGVSLRDLAAAAFARRGAPASRIPAQAFAKFPGVLDGGAACGVVEHTPHLLRGRHPANGRSQCRDGALVIA
jgi:hypothetical protein